jgi:hypothetical protein
MRIKLALATGAALAVVAGTTAAYAAVGQGVLSPTTAGNVLPIDDNHSPITAIATRSDDRGRTPEPGDDRGQAAEPGDDRGGATAAGAARAATPTDHGTRGGGSDDPTPAPRDHGGLTPAATTAPGAATHTDNRGRGGGSDDGSGHH